MVSSASGVLGGAPTTSDFGAFQSKKDAFGAIQIHHSGEVKELRLDANSNSPHLHPIKQCVERGELSYGVWGGAPAANDYGAF